jgi:hypothetical protein
MWRWPFHSPNCVFCECSSTTVWIHVERCTLDPRRHTVASANLPQHSQGQQHRAVLAHVTFHSHHSTRLAPTVNPSTLTQQRKRRACHSHPPRLAACHPWTALSAKHCSRLHKLAKRPLNEPLPCCAKTFVLLYPHCARQQEISPARSKHKTTQEISSPPSSSLPCDLPPYPYPATDLGTTNHQLCALRRQSASTRWTALGRFPRPI